MTDHLTRRHFLAALAASVVAAGAGLPIGFPKEVVALFPGEPWPTANWKRVLITVRFADEAREMPWLFVHTGDSNQKVEARQAA